MKRRIGVGALAVLGVVAVVLGGLYAIQRSLIYYPEPGPLPHASDLLPGGRDVVLRTEDGLRLGAWHFPARGTGGLPEGDAPTVLFAPGNGGNRWGRTPFAERITDAGINVLLLDYRGYGGNPGSPSESGLAQDARAAYDYLTGELDVPASRLLYVGESLGCGVVSQLATERPPAAMVLRSPFVDLASAGRVHYPFLPVRLLLKDRFPVAENVRGLSGVPVTVVAGTGDSIIPIDQSRRVAEAARGQLVEVLGADHNDLELLNGSELIDAVVRLAQELR